MKRFSMRIVAGPLVLLAGLLACNFPTYQVDLSGKTATPVSGQLTQAAPGEAQPTQAGGPAQNATAFPQAASTPVPTPPAYTPIFQAAPCAFPVPAGGYQVDCGYVAVPEDRSDTRANARMIRLHVAVFRSWANLPALDPVIHLAGGPGSSSLELAGYMFSQGLEQVLGYRDLVLFDQRGTGYSLPRLDCPERDDLTQSLLDGSRAPDARDVAIVNAFKRCRMRLIESGIDPAAYNSAASAADVNDIRRALGYTQVNLYGDSYGTRLALTIMRDFPQIVRSAVLDSTYPPQVNLYTTLAPNAERAFKVLFDRCAASATCNQRYPSLENVFYDLVDQLNASPVMVTAAVKGVEHPVVVDGSRLVDVLLVGLYNPAVAVEMPQMIYAVRAGNYDILRQRLALYFEPSTALGMEMGVQCGEEIPFSQPDEPFHLAQGVHPEIAQFFPAEVQALFTACHDWQTRPLDPRENQAVTSSLPTLVLAGEFDPITPPAWGQLAAKTLSHAYFYEVPGQGHWVTRSSRCALKMALAFWNNPNEAPDASCIQREPGLFH